MEHDFDPKTIESDKLYRDLGLTDDEFTKVKELLGRLPNYTETGIFSAMWSEHCSYKTSKSLLKRFPNESDRVLVGPGEGAGVVDIGDNQAVVFKIESHNSPSRINPYEGAATGVGGILRDVFSMGAHPIAALNSLRFGHLSDERTQYLFKEVVRGIADYGNEVGVPTVGGEVQFDASYEDAPLVNAMVVGLIDHDKIQKGLASGVGNTVIYAGAPTGRDGIHGAAHSSSDEVSEDASPAAGNPKLEKKLMAACLEVAEREELIGMQDMGAAGITSSGAEMAEKAGTGMEINLDLVPQRDKAMQAYEMMLSETQERMLLVVEKGQEEKFYEIFKKHQIDACAVGEVIEEEVFRIKQHGEVVANIATSALDAPANELPAKEASYFQAFQDEGAPEIVVEGQGETLKALLQRPTIANKSWVYDQFDSNALKNTVKSPGNGAAVVKIPEHDKAIAISTDCNSRYIYLDPENGGKIAVAEAVRNMTAAGATPIGITDGLNYGNPTNPEVFWQMEQSINGISEACRNLNVQVISGNVSMYNQSQGEPIYPTPVIGIVGLFDSLEHVTPNAFQAAGDIIYVIGKADNDFGGSELQYMMKGEYRGHAPKIDLETEKERSANVLSAIKKGYIQSAEDIAEGGLAVALAEKLMRTDGLGVSATVTRSETIELFSETQSRYLVSVKEEDAHEFEKICKDAYKFGVVTDKSAIVINGADGNEVIREDVDELRELWTGSIKQLLKSK